MPEQRCGGRLTPTAGRAAAVTLPGQRRPGRLFRSAQRATPLAHWDHLHRGRLSMTENQPAASTFDPRQLLAALRAVKKGDFTVRLPADQTGIEASLAEAFNDVTE